MPSYKIHSIKNNKKLSFIIDGESVKKIKEILSYDGFIVLTVEQIQEEKNKIPRFVFEALKENKSRIEGRIDALDIFSAYEILRDDYQYSILRLYPVDVTDPKEQEIIFKNILQIFPEGAKKEKEPIKNKSFTEVDLLKKYLSILNTTVSKSDLSIKELLIYDLRRVQMINSSSSIEEVIRKTIKVLYNKSEIEKKKEIYKIITPIAKHLRIFILPPWIFQIVLHAKSTISILKIVFSTEKNNEKMTKKRTISSIHFLQKNDTPEKKIFTNKNIYLLIRKKYQSSWLDAFKPEGSYLYFYSLLRNNRPLFWIKKIQEYIGVISLYICFFFIFGVIIVGGIFTPEFLFFNGFIVPIMSIVVLPLVFFYKEI